MIISDLSHFEEAVSEAPSIVGGAITKVTSIITADKLISEALLDLLSDETIASLKKTKLKVETVTLKQKGVSATVKTAKSKSGKVKISSSSSFAKA
jgi:hypothetical protein